MTYVVGYAPDERGKAALHLAAILARSSGEDLVVCSAVPAPWFPSMARVDAEYQAYVDRQADDALAAARANLPPDVSAEFVRHHARSAPTGILEVGDEHDAALIVLGSSSAGVFGHVALGSVTDRLLHSSPRPIALAPRGFRARTGAKVRRVTVAYGGSEAGDQLVLASASLAAGVGASLRLASFAVWSRPDYTMRLGTEGEDPVLVEWLGEMRTSAEEALKEVRGLHHVPHDLAIVVGVGSSWAEAIEDIEWEEGDVLLVGSAALGPVSRVFLGSRATKIVRHSPVPVVVLPSAAAEELAEQARPS